MHEALPAIPLTATGIAMIAIAILLVTLDPRGPATRALAVLLTWRGTSNLDLHLYSHASGLLPFDLAVEATVAFAGVAFLLVWPARRVAGAWPFVALAALAAVVFVAILQTPELMYGDARTSSVAVGGYDATTYGPLAFLNSLQQATYGAIGLVCAWGFYRGKDRETRKPYLLVALGFALTTTVHTWMLVSDLQSQLAYTSTEQRVFFVVREVSILLALAAAALLLAAGVRWRESRRLAVGSGALILGFGALDLVLRANPVTVGPFFASALVDAFLKMTIPVLVGYAVLRHRLFDIDLRIKWGIRRGTVVAVFLGVFFIASQIAQTFLTDAFGYLTGGLVAGLMLFAIAPLQRMAERVSDRAMPNVHEPVRKGGDADERAFREAVGMALADGVVTKQEERALHVLAERLAIPAERAWAIRDELERELGVNARV